MAIHHIKDANSADSSLAWRESLRKTGLHHVLLCCFFRSKRVLELHYCYQYVSNRIKLHCQEAKEAGEYPFSIMLLQLPLFKWKTGPDALFRACLIATLQIRSCTGTFRISHQLHHYGRLTCQRCGRCAYPLSWDPASRLRALEVSGSCRRSRLEISYPIQCVCKLTEVWVLEAFSCP